MASHNLLAADHESVQDVITSSPLEDREQPTQLTHEQQRQLSGAILTFEKANAAPDAVLTSASETLAGLPAQQRSAIMKVRRLYKEQRR